MDFVRNSRNDDAKIYTPPVVIELTWKRKDDDYMAEFIEIFKLKPHPRNTDFFDDVTGDNWTDFLGSIRESGVIEAITITEDNIIVSGHQRVRACQALSIDKIPYIIKEYKATDRLTVDDVILLDLIDANLKQRGGGNPNPIKMARCIRELERIYGIRQGSAGNEGTNRHRKSSGGNNYRGKTQKSLADDLEMSERQYRNIKKLCDAIPALQDMVESGKVSPTTVSAVWANLSKEEQSQFFDELGSEKVASMTGEETKKEISRLQAEMERVNSESTAREQEHQQELEDLRQKGAEEVEALMKKLNDAKAQLEGVSKSRTDNPDDSMRCFPVFCTVDDIPDTDEIDTPEEREQLLYSNPNSLLSQISSLDKTKCIAYRILERALGITDERNSLLVSWDDYVTLICEYDGTNFQKFAGKIQKYKTHKI